MKISQENFDKINTSILASFKHDTILCEPNTATWGMIMESAQKNGVKFGRYGWMPVRGVLQALLDKGIIERTKDLKVEVYKLRNVI